MLSPMNKVRYSKNGTYITTRCRLNGTEQSCYMPIYPDMVVVTEPNTDPYDTGVYEVVKQGIWKLLSGSHDDNCFWWTWEFHPKD